MSLKVRTLVLVQQPRANPHVAQGTYSNREPILLSLKVRTLVLVQQPRAHPHVTQGTYSHLPAVCERGAVAVS